VRPANRLTVSVVDFRKKKSGHPWCRLFFIYYNYAISILKLEAKEKAVGFISYSYGSQSGRAQLKDLGSQNAL